MSIGCTNKGTSLILEYPSECKSWFYANGVTKPNYPMPTVIGFQHTKLGTYMFDTRYRTDGMPLFKGYRIYYNPHMLFVLENECKQGWTWF